MFGFGYFDILRYHPNVHIHKVARSCYGITYDGTTYDGITNDTYDGIANETANETANDIANGDSFALWK